ncbi:MAG TPA: hypothetical protein VEZ48_05905 [Sphingomonadaceae bacterium]|nr:hypothetical protein [Sphingomonadaceae bacterium]
MAIIAAAASDLAILTTTNTVRADDEVAMPPAWLQTSGEHLHLVIVEAPSFPRFP